MTPTASGRDLAPPDDPSEIDPQTASRVARLMRWYPKDWRDRYGDEFEEVLYSALSDGKGGIRLSFDVAREGVSARLESAGFIGTTAPFLERARASVVTTVVAVVGFLISAATLAYYTRGWGEIPASESFATVFKTKAFRALAQAHLQRRPGGPGMTLEQHSRALRALFPRPLGASIVLNQIVRVAVDVAIACLLALLLVAVVACLRTVRRGKRSRLFAPAGLLMVSIMLFVLGELAYHSNEVSFSPGGWLALRWILTEGDYHLWPIIVFPLCTAGAVVFAVVGGVKLIRRVDFGPRLYRLEAALAVAAAGCIAVALVSTLGWAGTLYIRAPGFLTTQGLGVLGSPLLPVLLLAIVVMAGAGALATLSSRRCFRCLAHL